MKIVVFGANGVLGRHVCATLASRGHRVIRAARSGADLGVDFRFDLDPQVLRAAVRGADIVVNATGILIERDGNTWDAVHHRAVDALAAACEQERVARIVHVSALGAGSGMGGGYMASKQAGEEALARHAVDYAVVRPALLVDPDCQSTRLFARLAGMPLLVLPGLRAPGSSAVEPVLAQDVAECIARIAEHPKALRRVIELAGPQRMSYAQMLLHYRHAQGRGPVLRIPAPWWLMNISARLAQLLPQKVFSLDTMRMLRSTPAARSETARWLGRDPTPLPAALGRQPSGVASIA